MQHKKLTILADVLGSYRRSNDEYLFHCPYCNHHKKKMSVNFSVNAFKCWVCDQRGKNIYRLVRKFGNYKQRQQYLELIGRLDLSSHLQAILSPRSDPRCGWIRAPAKYGWRNRRSWFGVRLSFPHCL